MKLNQLIINDKTDINWVWNRDIIALKFRKQHQYKHKNVMNAKSRFEILFFLSYLFVSSRHYITKYMNLHKFVWDVGHTFVSPYKLHYLNNVTKFFIYVYIKPFNFSYYSSWLLNVIICVTNEYANVFPCLSICLWKWKVL